MKKKDISINFLKNNLNLFQCPVCQESFEGVKDNQLYCFKNHTFDISKKGTIHFLLHEANNHYDREALSARTKLAQTGFWQPILDQIATLVKEPSGSHLDVGCGEGSHLHYLKESGLTGNKIGFDISKEGVQLAAAQYLDIFWCVADLAQSPFGSGQFDTLFNIFSPSNYEEFDRLLKKGGQLIKVVPGTDYLYELRKALYGDSKDYTNKNVIKNFLAHYPNAKQIPLTYSKRLTDNQIKDFVKMTPLAWKADQDKLEEIKSKQSLTVTIDIVILMGEKGTAENVL